MCIEMRYLSRLDKLGFVEHLNYSKAKASDSTNTYNQVLNSRAAVVEDSLRGAGNITEAPPVADEAR